MIDELIRLARPLLLLGAIAAGFWAGWSAAGLNADRRRCRPR